MYSRIRVSQIPLWNVTSISPAHLRAKQELRFYPSFGLPSTTVREVLSKTEFNNCLSCTLHVPSRALSLVPGHPIAKDLSSPGDLIVATQLDDVSLNWSSAEVAPRDFFYFLTFLQNEMWFECTRYWSVQIVFENKIHSVRKWRKRSKQNWERGTEKERGKERARCGQRNEQNGHEDQCKDGNW